MLACRSTGTNSLGYARINLTNATAAYIRSGIAVDRYVSVHSHIVFLSSPGPGRISIANSLVRLRLDNEGRPTCEVNTVELSLCSETFYTQNVGKHT
jgi:hypothetical protein